MEKIMEGLLIKTSEIRELENIASMVPLLLPIDSLLQKCVYQATA
jgi:hypothetical protein